MAKSKEWNWNEAEVIGITVKCTKDRPLGSFHPRHKDFSDEEILRQIDFQEKFFDGVLVR